MASKSQENIRVFCRIRPLNSIELSKQSTFAVQFPGPNAITCEGKTFTFDGVFEPKTTQSEVFKKLALPVVQSVLSGYNGTIFAYGQTSSGKTHSMEGVLSDENLKGITPRIVEEVFRYIDNCEDDVQFLIKVAYMELYNEKIKDLLDSTKDNLPIIEGPNRQPVIKGLTERFVATIDEVYDVMEEGKVNRSVAFTNMNEASSRSHSIFTLSVEQEKVQSKQKLNGRLYLVDLAGSEKVSKTGAEGSVLTEAKAINQSLSVLGNVINGLCEGLTHVPYRDSKLTRILQPSLGGNAKTTMLIAASPATYNSAETKSTLLFGQRAKSIKNKVEVNLELSSDEWKQRYYKMLEKNKQLIGIIKRLETEVKKYRAGEKVDKADQVQFDTYQSMLVLDAKDEKAMTGMPSMPEEVTSPAPSETQSPKAKAAQAPAKSGAKAEPGTQAATAAAPSTAADSAQVSKLYTQLDEKDVEINKLGQKSLKLKQELDSLQASYKKVKEEREKNQTKLSQLTTDNDTKTKEMKEVLQALEDLAVNFDAKSSELKLREDELQDIKAKLQTAENQIKVTNAEAKGIEKTKEELNKKVVEMLHVLFPELGGLGRIVNPKMDDGPNMKTKITDEIDNMKIFIGKIKTEVKNMQHEFKVNQPIIHAEMQKKVELMQKEVDRVKKTAEEQRVVCSNDKKKIHAELDAVKRDVMRLEADAKIAASALDIKSNKKDVYEKVMGNIRTSMDKYLGDLNETRAQIAEKTKEANEMRDKLELANAEVEILRKFALVDGEKMADKREIARAELKGLEDNVVKELQTLHSLRQTFIADLKGRIKKATGRKTIQSMLEDDEDELNFIKKMTPAQREKMSFLESNLENLTGVHKALVRDNADLRCELPKMEKRLKATMERIKQLETALRESKENCIRDKRKMQNEIDRLVDAARQRPIARRTIARPIQAGGAKKV